MTRRETVRVNKKSELMLMRRARAYMYSSSSSQIILVYLHPSRRSSFFCSRKSPKISKNPYFWNSVSFNVDDIDIPKKLVASACYDKQHACAYLQPFSR